MNKDYVVLEDIIFVVGFEENRSGKKLLVVPYVIKPAPYEGYEEVHDLTDTWASIVQGKATFFDVMEKFKREYENSRIMDVLTSAEAIQKYILNHENKFRYEMIADYGPKVHEYCHNKVLGYADGPEFIEAIKGGVKEHIKELNSRPLKQEIFTL